MALSLYLDKVDGAQIALNETDSYVVRRGLIKGLKTTGLPTNQILMACVTCPGMPNYNDVLFGGSTFVLRQRLFEGLRGNSDKVGVTLIYRALGLGSPIATFILSRQTTLIQTASEYHPDKKKPIEVFMTTHRSGPPPAGTTNYSTELSRKIQVAVPYEVPLQVLTASAYYHAGPPPDDVIDALGTVNDATWRGKPIGFWKYAEQSDVTRDYGNTYNITLGLHSKLRRDWSEWKFLRDELQNFVPPDPADIATLDALPYQYAILHKNKVTKVGMFPTANFSGIFGFGGIGMPF